MAKSKMLSCTSKTFMSGGKGHMFGRQYAGPQKPGTSATATKTGTGGKVIKPGGSGRMAGFTGSRPARAM